MNEEGLQYIKRCNEVKAQIMPSVEYNTAIGTSNITIPNIVVSLSCHPNYWRKAKFAIESMLIQTVKPNNIVLYLSNKINEQEVLEYYKRWIDRGLTIKFREDIGPATKFWYALREYSDSIVITIDADRIYSSNMIEQYFLTYLRSDRKSICSAINIYAHKVYKFYCRTGLDVLYPEGFAGILYPPGIFDEEFFNLEIQQKYARCADDVWIYVNILRLGIKVVSVINNPNVFQVQNYDDEIIANNLHTTNNVNIDIGWNIPFANLAEHYGLIKRGMND